MSTAFHYDDQIEYTCQEGHTWVNSSGPLGRKCEPTGRWSGEKPTCLSKNDYPLYSGDDLEISVSNEVRLVN